MAVLSVMFAGASHPLPRSCIAAERDPNAAARALRALDSLEPLPRRRLLAVYAALDALVVECRREAVR
jgi:hypothetical protein